MKIIWLIYLFSALSILSSCRSALDITDDDVYIVGAGELPLGESLNDETSYSNYREERANDQDADYFSANGPLYSSNFLMFSPYSNWGYTPYWSGFYMGYGNPWCYGYGWNMYGMNYWDPYYGYYYPYGNFYNPYMGGFGYQQYNYGSPHQIVANTSVHQGPRGSWVSTNNPANRPQQANGLLKSAYGKSSNNPSVAINNSRVFRSNNQLMNTRNTIREQKNSPLIHQEVSRKWRPNEQNTFERTSGNVINNSINRTSPTLPKTNRIDNGNRVSPTRQTPPSRPTRPSPTPGRRL
jgi:hypothetical protein